MLVRKSPQSQRPSPVSSRLEQTVSRRDKAPEAQRVAAAGGASRRLHEEQAVAESIEQDGRDDEASHVVVVDQHHRVVATGRILISDDGSAKIQRVAVDRRGLGVWSWRD